MQKFLFQATRTSQVILQKPALLALKDYEKQKAEGKDPVFHPTPLGIKDADFWVHEYQNDLTSQKKE